MIPIIIYMSLDNKNQENKNMTESQIDAKNNFSLKFDEKFNYSDSYTVPWVRYDSAHGKSIYSDGTPNYQLGYDSEEDESVQELKEKLVGKIKTFY